MLCRCDLVMLGFCVDAELPELLIELAHEVGDTLRQVAEVVIVHFLALRRLCAEQRSAGQDEVLTGIVACLVDQEVFLLRSDIRYDALYLVIAEQPEHPDGRAADGFHGTEQRSLLIKHLTGIRNKTGRDAEGAVLDEGIRGRVPCGIAACLEGRAQSAGRERGCVRFTLDELLAGEIEDDTA